MKIVALNSSFRQGGNTEQIIRGIERHLEAQDRSLQFEYIPLAKANIGFCRGCRACFDRGEDHCPLQDDLLSIYKKLQEADGVIFASPVYAEDASGIMKNFIDRMAWNNHRPSFAGKTALIITTSGMGSSNHSVRTIKFAIGAWGFHISGIRKFRMGALMDKNAAAQAFDSETAGLAGKLMNAVTRASPMKPSLMSLVFFKVQQKCYQADTRSSGNYDNTFWMRSGWLDNSRSFYIDHRANAVKTILAKVLGGIIALFYK